MARALIKIDVYLFALKILWLAECWDTKLMWFWSKTWAQLWKFPTSSRLTQFGWHANFLIK